MDLWQGLPRALFILVVLPGINTKISFPIDTSIDKDHQYIRSLEFTDSNELYPDNDNRKESDDERWTRWTDKSSPSTTKNKKLPPHEKTISFQLVDDDDPYHHGRPAWPHDEYLVNFYDFNRTPVRNESAQQTDTESENVETPSANELSKYYEWKRLQPRPSPSAFIGPGFYDVGSSSNYYGAAPLTPAYYRYQPTHQAITDGTANVQNTQSQNGNSETVPGTPSESVTNTRQFGSFSPFDYYRRKRLRLQIHPGLIAAPLAGIAAFGAASALTSKPLLLELGYVRNKADLAGGGGGWGLAGNVGSGFRPYPPFYPPPNLPHHHHPGGGGGFGVGPGPGGGFGGGGAFGGPGGGAFGGPGGGGFGGPGGGGIGHGHAHSTVGPVYPILRPVRGRPDDNRSSWWNPFSALTPRLVVE